MSSNGETATETANVTGQAVRFNRPHHGMLTCGPFVRLEVPMAALEFSVGIALSLGGRAP